MADHDLDPRAQALLTTWFGAEGDDLGEVSQRWWTKDPAFDARLRDQFGDLIVFGAAGGLSDWERSPEGTLALILLLDQVSRNIWRGSPRSFAQDASARELAHRALARGDDRMLAPERRAFVYMPFMHSEQLADHATALERFEALEVAARGTPAESLVANNLKYQRMHTAIIRRFGRYPHRNEVLGRASSAGEAAYVEEHGGF